MSTALQYKDFTIKAKSVNQALLEKQLDYLNVEFIGTDNQHDTYFEVLKGKLKLRRGSIENLITHYERVNEQGTERTIVYRYDLNPTAEQIDDLFNTHTELGTFQKERKIYRLGNIKIHLDKIAEDEIFLEIEAQDHEGSRSDEELKAQCLELKDQLEILDEQLIETGYF